MRENHKVERKFSYLRNSKEVDNGLRRINALFFIELYFTVTHHAHIGSDLWFIDSIHAANLKEVEAPPSSLFAFVIHTFLSLPIALLILRIRAFRSCIDRLEAPERINKETVFETFASFIGKNT